MQKSGILNAVVVVVYLVTGDRRLHVTVKDSAVSRDLSPFGQYGRCQRSVAGS